MTRLIKVAAAQVGAVHRGADRKETTARLIKLLEDGAAQGAQLVVFPETALTTFFPRWQLESDELASYFDGGVESPHIQPLIQRAKELGVDICIGYAEKTEDGRHFNTCSYVHDGTELSKYRKVHLPGTFEPFENKDAINQLEKRYFLPGDLGFKAFRVPGLAATNETQGEPILGMMICNDRRWAEAWRCYGLQGAELVLVGYNTANWAPDLFGHPPDWPVERSQAWAERQHLLVMQCHSYTNACWSISSARCGYDDGVYGMIGCSTIINPDGEVVAISKTMDDEIVLAEIDLDDVKLGKKTTFDFGRHRRLESYEIITAQTGVVEPPRLS